MNEEDYAIVIGVTYAGYTPPLQATLTDAAAFIEWLKSPTGGGVPEKNIKPVLSPPVQSSLFDEGQPTDKSIKDALGELGLWDENRARKGRRFYFYFSGHGFGTTFDEVGMLMATATPQRLERCIGLHPYRDRFVSDAPFDQIIFILDCCRDHKDGKIRSDPRKRRGGPIRPGTVDDFVVLAAPYGNEAFEGKDPNTGVPRGFLTQAVLEALKDPCNADVEGRFTSDTLTAYIRQRIPELAVAVEKKQKLDVEEPQEVIVFARIDAPTKTVHIIAPAGSVGDLVLLDGDNLKEVGRCPAKKATEQNPWKKDLFLNSQYELVLTGGGKRILFSPNDSEEDPHVVRYTQ